MPQFATPQKSPVKPHNRHGVTRVQRPPASPGHGSPFDGDVRSAMEPRFNSDFSQVRVHSDDNSAATARASGALGYRMRPDILFGPGQYRSPTASGRRLPAHVVQQADAQPVKTWEVDPVQSTQRMLGSQAVARLLGRTKNEAKPGNSADKLIDGGTKPTAPGGVAVSVAGMSPPATPMTPTPAPAVPAGPPWRAGSHVTPTFTVTETEGPRSNVDPATTDVDTPTFTGGATVDAAARVWRYQINSVEGNGRITFVFYTSDHYPAPTPNDDSGALSKVTKANWNDVVKDLESHKNGVAGNWSAYRRTILHERYHWGVEWQGSVKTELAKAENDIAKDGVSLGAAADAAAAERVLAPRAASTFANAMAAARNAYNALGDSPGDPPYRAGSVGATDLAARIRQYAAAQKW